MLKCTRSELLFNYEQSDHSKKVHFQGVCWWCSSLCLFVCRSRLADFHMNCMVTQHTVSSCPNEDNYQACLASYAGLIGECRGFWATYPGKTWLKACKYNALLVVILYLWAFIIAYFKAYIMSYLPMAENFLLLAQYVCYFVMIIGDDN